MAEGEYAVDDKLDEFEQACRCADVPGVADSIPSNGDSGLVGVFLVGPILAYNFGVRDLVTEVMGDIFVLDHSESISYLNAFLFGYFRSLIYALA